MEYELRQIVFGVVHQVYRACKTMACGALMILTIVGFFIRELIHFIVLPVLWTNPRRPPMQLSTTSRTLAKGTLDATMVAIPIIASVTWLW